MDLLYKSTLVDIYFDPKKNLLVQKWKQRPSGSERVSRTINYEQFAAKLNEIVVLDLYHQPQEDIEDELQIMLFQSFQHVAYQA